MALVRKFWFPAVLLLALLAGRDWLRLGWQAWHYPVAAAHAREQLVVAGNTGYVAGSQDGFEVHDLIDQRSTRVSPPNPADSIDDLALADGLLFALDAVPPGHLLVYSLADPLRPRLVDGPVAVDVGPFSGVSAAAGVVAVSGGTSRLSLRSYDREGHLGRQIAQADFGRGQPDIALRDDGRVAAISTHLYGPKFALTVVGIERSPLALQTIGQLALPEAGFTDGGFKPAHFPLVARWAGPRLYVAHGGGLDSVAADTDTAPRLFAHDARAAPAMDLALADGQLYVLRAGSAPAVLRYRLDANGSAQLEATMTLAPTAHPASLAALGRQLFLIDQLSGWQALATDAFAPIAIPPPH